MRAQHNQRIGKNMEFSEMMEKHKNTESFQKVSSISAVTAPPRSMDWRNLTAQEKKDISGNSAKTIANLYGVSERTALNWRKRANSIR